MDEKLLDRLIGLVDAALRSLADLGQRLSATIQNAIRIARLSSDWNSLWWLEAELWSLEKFQSEKKRLVAETQEHLTHQQLKDLNKETMEAWMETRSTVALQDGPKIRKGEKGLMGLSVFEMEQGIDNAERATEQLTVPSGLHPVDLYFENQEMRKAKLGNLAVASAMSP